MYPEIFRYGDFVISSFGLMMVIAFITCNYILRKDLVKYGYVNVHSEESCGRLLDEYDELRDNPDLGHINQLLGSYDYKRFIKEFQNGQQK